MQHLIVASILCIPLFRQYSGYEYFSSTNANLEAVPSIPDTADWIDLSNNLITEVTPNDFGNLISLKSLNLRNNRLTKFPNLGNKKSTITSLKLYSNDIQEIPQEYLLGMDNLRELMIFSNPNLKVLPDVSFISTLKTFNFAECGLTRLMRDYFPESLESITGGNNPYSSLNLQKDLPSKNLGKFTLNNVPKILGGTARKDLIKFKKLTRYIAVGSGVEKLPDLFYAKDWIKVIQLQYNKIQKIDYPEIEFMLSPLTSGKRKYYLEGNLLTTFPCFEDIKNHTEILNLSFNKLHCDCRLRDLLQAVQESGNTFPKVSLYPCVSPPHLTTFSWDELQLQDLICRDGSGPLFRYERQGVNLKFEGPYLMTTYNTTVLGCLRTCHANEDCWRFNFENKTGRCEMIGHSRCVRIEAEGVDIYEFQ